MTCKGKGVVWKVVVGGVEVTMVTQQLSGKLHSGRRRHLINNSLMRPASGKSRLTQIGSEEAPVRPFLTKQGRQETGECSTNIYIYIYLYLYL